MRRLLLSLILLAAASIFVAPNLQAQNVEGQIIASQFGSFQVPGIATGSLQFEPATCQVSGGGKNFAAFATGVPVKIVDSNPALNEIDTPSNVFINQCAVSMSTSHIHATPFYLTSGTGGLQEAITNGPVKGGGPNTIILNSDWYALVSPGTPSAVIASVTGNTNLGLVDVTTTPYTTYRWNGSQYVVNTVTGATLPATSLVYKGTNTLGVAQAATPGTDYVIPSGSVASLNTASALPNNTTASTQTTGDGSTKVATDAFVLANAGGASAPATPNVYKGNGSLNGIIAATPGVDYNAPSATNLFGPLGTASGGTNYSSNFANWCGSYGSALPDCFEAQNQVASTGANPVTFLNIFNTGSSGYHYINFVPPIQVTGGIGINPGAYAAGFVVTQPAGQGAQQVNQAYGTTLGVNDLNNTFNADGFSGYGGIGQAQVPFTGSADVPMCQAVSYSASNYVALAAVNHTITPGTNYGVWYPVTDATATTNETCAFYFAAAYTRLNHTDTEVKLGYGVYDFAQLVEPIDGNNYDDIYSVHIKGCGINCSYMLYTGTAAVPAITRPTGGGNYTWLNIDDVRIDGGGVATSLLDLGSLNAGHFKHVGLYNPAPGSNHMAEFGLTPGDAFGIDVQDLEVNANLSGGIGNTATIVANVVGGSITSYTVSSGGSNYRTTSSAFVNHVLVLGNKSGTSSQPCTVMPTGQVVTISGGAVTAISEGSNSGGSGCSGTIDVQVTQSFPLTNGVVWNASDSLATNVQIASGDTCGITVLANNNKFYGLHPQFMPNGICNNESNANYHGTELDNIYVHGFDFGGSSASGATVDATNTFNQNTSIPGQSVYYFESGATGINFGAQGNLANGGKSTDWHEFMTSAGPIDLGAAWPAGVSVHGNDTLSATTGDVVPNAASGPAWWLDPADANAEAYIAIGQAPNFMFGWGGGTTPGLGTVLQSSYGITFSVGSSTFLGGHFGGGFTPFAVPQFEVGTAVASASTIAPTYGGVIHVTGSTQVNTITPGGGCTTSGIGCSLDIISDGGFPTGTSGNISVAVTTIAGYLYRFVYDPATSKWSPTGGSSGGSMVYPGAGIANSTGSAWGTSYTTSGSGTALALANSPTLVTPTLGVATATSVTATSLIPAGTPVIDVRSQGAKCDGSTDDTTAIATAATLAGTDSGILYIPNTGTACLTASAVSLPVNAWMDVEGDLKATGSMTAVVTVGDGSHTAVSKTIYGHGTIDPNGVASRGVFVRAYQHYVVQDVLIGNAPVAGIEFGDSTLSCRSGGTCFEGYAINTHEFVPTATAKTTGSIGIDEVGSDCYVSGNVIVGYDIGVSDSSSGCWYIANHVWGQAIQLPSICYDSKTGNSNWTNNVCDSPTSEGFFLEEAFDQLIGNRVDTQFSNGFYGMYFEYGSPGDLVSGNVFEGSGPSNLMTAAFGGFASSGLSLLGNNCGSYVTTCNVVPSNYGVGAGTANVQTVTIMNGSGPYPGQYAVGQQYCWLPVAANTSTTPTINVNSLGALTITKFGQGALALSDLTTTAIACGHYDGTYMQLENPATLMNAAATVASGSLALATNSISSAGCQAVSAGTTNSAAATGVASTDVIQFTPNASIKAVTGYTPATAGGLTITPYPTAGFVNFDVCNWTANSVTPGAVTLNWKVTR